MRTPRIHEIVLRVEHQLPGIAQHDPGVIALDMRKRADLARAVRREDRDKIVTFEQRLSIRRQNKIHVVMHNYLDDVPLRIEVHIEETVLVIRDIKRETKRRTIIRIAELVGKVERAKIWRDRSCDRWHSRNESASSTDDTEQPAEER